MRFSLLLYILRLSTSLWHTMVCKSLAASARQLYFSQSERAVPQVAEPTDANSLRVSNSSDYQMPNEESHSQGLISSTPHGHNVSFNIDK
jgi:hypothetical protein